MHPNKTQAFFQQFKPKPQKKLIPTRLRTLWEIFKNESYFNDPQNRRGQYWDEELYNQEKVQFKHRINKTPERTEYDGINTDSHLSDKVRYASIIPWTVNSQLPNNSPIPSFTPQPTYKNWPNLSFHTEIILQLQNNPAKTQNCTIIESWQTKVVSHFSQLI